MVVVLEGYREVEFECKLRVRQERHRLEQEKERARLVYKESIQIGGIAMVIWLPHCLHIALGLLTFLLMLIVIIVMS